MPFIRTTTNVTIMPERIKTLKQRMGEAIALIPGKSEQWLMLAWDDEAAMTFQGKDTPCAMCEVKLYGAADPACYNELTAALCRIIEEELGVPQSRVYVSYQETEHWGWNGGNF